MTLPGYIFGANRRATEAGGTARPENAMLPAPSELQLGTIVTVQTNGLYTVGVLDEQGRVVARVRNARPVGEDPGLEEEDPVLLRFVAGAMVPQIIPLSGHGGYAYWQGYRDAGYWGAVAD